MTSSGVSIVNFKRISHFFSVSEIDIEQVNLSWVVIFDMQRYADQTASFASYYMMPSTKHDIYFPIHL